MMLATSQLNFFSFAEARLRASMTLQHMIAHSPIRDEDQTQVQGTSTYFGLFA